MSVASQKCQLPQLAFSSLNFITLHVYTGVQLRAVNTLAFVIRKTYLHCNLNVIEVRK